MRINKKMYINNIIERLENINYGSYEVDEEYGEDYFGTTDYNDEIIQKIINIIPDNSNLSKNELNNIQSLIDNIEVSLTEPTGYKNFHMFFNNEEKLGNVIYTDLENYIIE